MGEIVLAIDSSTRTGWAAGPAGANPTDLRWGTRDFGRGKTNGEVISRFRYFVTSLVAEHKVTLLCFEAPYIPVPRAPRFGKAGNAVARGGGAPPMNPLTLRRLLALVGEVEAVAFERQIRCYEATPLEITRHFTGRGRHGGRDAKKAATIAHCRALGFDVADDNAADAIALFCYAESIIDPVAAARRRSGAGLELPLHGVPSKRRSTSPKHLDDKESSHAEQQQHLVLAAGIEGAGG